MTLVKEVTNNDGGTGVAEDWTLTANYASGEGGAGRDISAAGGTGGAVAVYANAVYDLAESSAVWVDGVEYNYGSFSCEGGTQVGQTIELGLGESATCTIINNDIGPKLTLVKEVTNNDGGTGVAEDWTLTANYASGEGGAGRDISAAGGTGGAVSVYANAVYDLAESSAVWVDGVEYNYGSFSCEGGTQVGQTIESGSRRKRDLYNHQQRHRAEVDAGQGSDQQ